MAAPLDDAVAAAAAGDERAFTTVYRAVQPPLLRYLRVRTLLRRRQDSPVRTV